MIPFLAPPSGVCKLVPNEVAGWCKKGSAVLMRAHPTVRSGDRHNHLHSESDTRGAEGYLVFGSYADRWRWSPLYAGGMYTLCQYISILASTAGLIKHQFPNILCVCLNITYTVLHTSVRIYFTWKYNIICFEPISRRWRAIISQ